MIKEKELLNQLDIDLKKIFKDERIENYVSLRNASGGNTTVVFIEKEFYCLRYIGSRESENSIIKFIEYSEFRWKILDEIVTNKALNYARNNIISGKDFRRQLFLKEIEYMRLFSKEYGERKEKEVQEILAKYPYSDLLSS